MNGLSWLFWGIGLALPAWWFIWRRWAGLGASDGAVSKGAAMTYIPPSGACKAIERF